MALDYVENKLFDKVDFTHSRLTKGEYENCTFSNCNFSHFDFSNFIFSNCEFKSCNLSLANLTKTALREVAFLDCKLTGLGNVLKNSW
jgi:uncharacterized protein YjbI with pentapeptide repeats